MSQMKKVVASTMLGNGLEWYDYALYGTFTALISKHFFPAGDENVALIATFGIFAIGFLFQTTECDENQSLGITQITSKAQVCKMSHR